MDTATFSAALKTQFIGPIRQVLHSGRVLLYGSDSDPNATSSPATGNPTDFKGIQSTAEGIDFVGNEFRIPIETARNNSVGFRSENEVLPAPGSGQYTYISDQLRYAYALLNITGPLIQAASSDQGAFATAFKAGMESSVLQSKVNMNRAAYGDSTGVMATATGANTAAVVPVDSTINFRTGEIVDIATKSTGVIATGNAALTVVAVNRSGLTVTLSATPGTTVTTAMGLYSASSDSAATVPNNSYNKEINGLGNIVSASGVLHGLNPATYPFWASYVLAVNGSVNDVVLRSAKDNVGFNTGLDLEAGLDFALVTTRGIRTRYAQTLTSLKRFAEAAPVQMHGGFTAVMFDENPIFTDDACPVGTVYGLAMNKLLWIRATDWSWMEEDGKVMKWDSRRDRYVSVLYSYLNLGTTHRGAHFKLTGITDDTR